MTTQTRKRPKRLWAVALLDIFYASISLAAILFLSLSSQVPDDLRLTPMASVLPGLATAMLILWSVLALCGIAWARCLMLVAALFFFGSIIVQNLQLYAQAHDAAEGTMQLVANIVRTVISMAFNLWALLSAKTRLFFAPESQDTTATVG